MSTSDTPRDDEAAVPAEWSPGDVILGLYEVKGILGEGGMGRVYRVHHRGWDVDLAVKSPRAEVLAAGGTDAFVREAEAWADLGLHPHTVSCYYVRTLGGIPRVFAECVEGGSLHDWIRDRRLYEGGPDKALARTLDVAIQFAWGLDYAHERGLVHQDVKPHNVMMTPDASAKVTDFGLANARGGDRTTSSQVPGGTLLVSSGGMTPAYCSPEQAARERLTRRTDVWSWAVSVLEMFTGEVTWRSGLAAPSVLEAYLDVPAEEPGLARMPAQVADLLRACFASDPNERPRTMADVASRLREIHTNVLGEPHAREASHAAPDTADSLNNRALSLLDLGRGDKAEALWAAALRLHSDHPESTYNRGVVRWRTADGDDAALLRHLRMAERGDWLTLYAQALVHLERADAQGALDALARVPEEEKGHPELLSAAAAARTALTDSGRLLRTFEGHTWWVRSVQLSADGRNALSPLKLWDVDTGRCVRTFEGHRIAAWSVHLSADGRRALSGSADQTLRLWDVDTGSCVRTFGGHTGTVLTVRMSADGRHAVSGSEDKTLKLWDVATGSCLRTFEAHTDQVHSVRVSADGRHALSASSDKTLKLWELRTGSCLRTYEGHTGSVRAVDLTADGRHALSGGGDSSLKLWEVDTGRCLRTFAGHTDSVLAVHFSADGRHAVSGSADKSLKLWEVDTGRCLRTFEGHTGLVLSVHLSEDGGHALSGSADQTLKLWEVAPCRDASPSPLLLTRVISSEAALRTQGIYQAEIKFARSALISGEAVGAAGHVRRARALAGHGFGKEAMEIWGELHGRLPRGELRGAMALRTFEAHAGGVHSVRLGAHGRHALSGGQDNTLMLWELATGRCLRTFEGHADRVLSVDLSADGRHALSGSQDHTLKLWEVATGQCLRTFEKEHTDQAHSVHLSADGRRALSGSQDKSLKLWDVATGHCLRTFEGHTGWVHSIHLSADGRHALSGSLDKTLKLWEVGTGRCLRTFEGHTSWVESVRLSEDGRSALSGSDDHSLKLWEVDTGRCLRTFEGHAGSVRAVDLTADGRHALSGSQDNTLKLWELATGRCLRTFEGHVHGVNSVHLSPDGRHALSGSWDNKLRLWYLDWELEDREPADWDERARPYLETFVRCQALTRKGRAVGTEKDLKRLLTTLGHAGYGWLRPEGVRRKLEELAPSRSSSSKGLIMSAIRRIFRN